VLAGESVADALGDRACNSKAGAEASEDSVLGSHEPTAGTPGAVRPADPARDACPQPWCTFSLLRLRLTELGSAAAPEPMVTARDSASTS
jgi:hypothetical protein